VGLLDLVMGFLKILLWNMKGVFRKRRLVIYVGVL
jgi:hypothetical protein